MDVHLQFGEPPWTLDGSANSHGVPYGRFSDMVVCKERQLDDYDTPGWACRKCGTVVRAQPRAFAGAKEPVDWWWCRECQGKHSAAAPKSLSEKKNARAATGCAVLESAFAMKRV